MKLPWLACAALTACTGADVTLDGFFNGADGMATSSDAAVAPAEDDGGAVNPPVDGGGNEMPDGGTAQLPQGDDFSAPGSSDSPVAHASPAPLAGAVVRLAGVNVLDVSTDQGGGVWAVSYSTVYYFPSGREAPFTYTQADGLARGQTTWQDTYYEGTPTAPVTLPTSFSAVAGATAGQAIVGNVGAIADRLIVDPVSGAILAIDNMAVTPENSMPDEYPDHLMRVVATVAAVVDVDGTLAGTAYVGGWHGFSAFHGIAADCGCMAFEQHLHYLPGPPLYCDSTPGDSSCWDGEVWGLALTPSGDLWAGDRHFAQLLPQRSQGTQVGFFDYGFAAGIDVFPGVRDEIRGLAVDAAGGVYVASDGNGLAYLAPGAYQATYWSSATRLPMNHLRGVAVDALGEVWVATQAAGLARLKPSTNTWTYYTEASPLPSNWVNRIYADRFAAGRHVLVATSSGIVAYAGE